MSQIGCIGSDFPDSPRDNRPYFIKAPPDTKSCPFCDSLELEAYREPCTFMSDYDCIRCNTCHAKGPSKGFDEEWDHEFTWNHREGS
jgi:hypothetical protein